MLCICTPTICTVVSGHLEHKSHILPWCVERKGDCVECGLLNITSALLRCCIYYLSDYTRASGQLLLVSRYIAKYEMTSTNVISVDIHVYICVRIQLSFLLSPCT